MAIAYRAAAADADAARSRRDHETAPPRRSQTPPHSLRNASNPSHPQSIRRESRQNVQLSGDQKLPGVAAAVDADSGPPRALHRRQVAPRLGRARGESRCKRVVPVHPARAPDPRRSWVAGARAHGSSGARKPPDHDIAIPSLAAASSKRSPLPNRARTTTHFTTQTLHKASILSAPVLDEDGE